jgi:hypothetical protein
VCAYYQIYLTKMLIMVISEMNQTLLEMQVYVNIKQITEGFEYDGVMIVNENKFTHNVCFVAPILEIIPLEPIPLNDPEAAFEIGKQVFTITLKRNRFPIEMEAYLFCFLATTVIDLIVGYYFDPFAHIVNRMFLQELENEIGPNTEVIKKSIRFGTEHNYDFPYERIPKQLLLTN